MKTIESLNDNILKITMQIQLQFPELTKYLNEMPVTIPDERNPEISVLNLQDYDESLRMLLFKYAKSKDGFQQLNHIHMNKNNTNDNANDDPKIGVDGYPIYPGNEDIYLQNEELSQDADKDIVLLKDTKEKKYSKMNEKNFEDDVSGGDLDVPGSELDDEQEAIGSEDEENNSYSIGGDNHNNLEEEKE